MTHSALRFAYALVMILASACAFAFSAATPAAAQAATASATEVPPLPFSISREQATAAFEALDLEGLDPAVSALLERERSALFRLLEGTPEPMPNDDTPPGESTETRALLVDAWGEAGLVAHAHGQFTAAAAAYTRASTLAPGDSRWDHALGLARREGADFDAAAISFRRALAIAPQSIAPTYYLAEIALGEGRLDEAETLATQVEAALPLSPAAFDLLGRIALERGDAHRAIEHLETALRQVPEANRLHYPLALAHRSLGNLDAAREHLAARGPVGVRPPDGLRQAIEDRKTGERLLLLRGKRAFAAGRFVEAAEAFAEASAAAPGSAGTRVNWAAALSQLGDLAGAETQLRRALELDPDSTTALFNMATLDLRAGRIDAAIERFERVAAAAPGDLEAQRQLGVAYARAGRFAEALQSLDRVADNDPRDELLQVERAEALIRLDRLPEAIEILETLRRALPTAGLPMHLLARVLAVAPDLSLRDGERAVELARSVVDAAPTALHRETLVLALSEAGRCAEAAAAADALLSDLRTEANDAGAPSVARRIARLERLRDRARTAGAHHAPTRDAPGTGCRPEG